MTTGITGDLNWLASLLGLSEAEHRAYMFLHRTGGAGAGAVASEVGLPRGRIYELLRGLVHRGLVRELPGPRIHYAPVPLGEVLASLRIQTSQQLQLLERASEQLPPSPVVDATAVPRTRPGDVSVLHGRRAVEAEVRRLLERAHRRFLLAGGKYLAERLSQQTETLGALTAARARDVEIVVVLPNLAEEERARSRLADVVGQDALRLVPPEAVSDLTHVVSDSVVLLVVVQPVDGAPARGADVGIRIEGRAIVDAFRQRFDQLSTSVPSVSVAGLGPAYTRAIENAKQEVIAMGPREWQRVLEATHARLGPCVQAARERGVRLRALTEDAPEDPQRVSLLASDWETRLMPAVPVWVTIVDGVELQQAYPAKGGAGGFQVRSSRDPTEVRYWLEWFERWWSEARPVRAAQL